MDIKEVIPGIYRSAQPQTQDDFEQILKLGITVICDLENESGESPWEQAQWAHLSSAVDFHSIPMSGFWAPSKDSVTKFMSIVDNSIYDKEPTLVHCVFGRERTGLMSAIILEKKAQYSKIKAWRNMLENGYRWWFALGLDWFFWIQQ